MDLLEAAGRALRSPAFKFVLILFLIVLLLIPLALVYALIWGAREPGGERAPRGRPAVGPRAAHAGAVPGGAIHGARRNGTGRQALRADPGAPGRIHPRGARRCWPRRRQDAAALHLRGAGLCCAPEAVGAVRRAAHRRCCGRGGGGALARCRVRARPDRCLRPQGGRNPQDRRRNRYPLRAEHRLSGHPAYRHPRQARRRRRWPAARSRAAAAAVRLHRRPCLQRLRLAHRGAGCARDARVARLRLAASELRRRVPAGRTPGDAPPASRQPGRSRTWRAACPRPGASRTEAWSGCSRMRSA